MIIHVYRIYKAQNPLLKAQNIKTKLQYLTQNTIHKYTIPVYENSDIFLKF